MKHLVIHDNISIHALREEGDGAAAGIMRPVCDFYPRPPRGGRPPAGAAAATWGHISIHALREEGDADLLDRWDVSIEISIHALREEGD